MRCCRLSHQFNAFNLPMQLLRDPNGGLNPGPDYKPRRGLTFSFLKRRKHQTRSLQRQEEPPPTAIRRVGKNLGKKRFKLALKTVEMLQAFSCPIQSPRFQLLPPQRDGGIHSRGASGGNPTR
jgi:hypothetical protein